MENIALNIEKLLNTKSAIKQAIIDKGISVTDTDTFASYADKIRSINSGKYETVNIDVLDSSGCNVSNATVTLSYFDNEIKQINYTGSTLTINIPEEVNYKITVFNSDYKYLPLIYTSTNGEISDIKFSPVQNGVYIYDTYGNLTKEENWDTANNSLSVGVAVITDNSSFVIDKEMNNSSMIWGAHGKIVTGAYCTPTKNDAKKDYSGESNTSALLTICESDSAVYYCKNRSCIINGTIVTGYLGALGEWVDAYNNKTKIDSALTTIGSSGFSSWYWSSTQYNIYYSYSWTWYSGSSNYIKRDLSDSLKPYVCAFFPLRTIK